MNAKSREALAANLTDEEALALAHDWQVWARDNQLPPAGAWFVWLVLAGRGFGKTRTGAEWVLQRVRDGARRIALVAPTAADTRDTMVEGPAGILRCAHPTERPLYEPSKRRLTWPNGAVATTFSAEEPERLRGPQHDTAWCDELCAWRYSQETWDQLMFGLRQGDDPRVVVTTTPRPIPLLRTLLGDANTRTTRGSTYDNSANLARRFLEQLRRKHEGTRLGRQELFADVLEDTPGALWTLAMFDKNRVQSHPDFARAVVAVDPQASDPTETEAGAETGIVAGGIAGRHGYLTHDRSGRYTPAEWGEHAVLLHDEIRADAIVAEKNNGGAMVGYVVKSAAEKLYRAKRRATPHINVNLVSASRGKQTRAEPVSALDEQGLLHHVGAHAVLEDQCTTWVPNTGKPSPDRMDARVWLFTELMLGGAPPEDGDLRPIPVDPRHPPAARPGWGDSRDDDDDDGGGWGRRRS